MDFVALCRGFMKERTESQFRDLEAPIKVSSEGFAVMASPQLKINGLFMCDFINIFYLFLRKHVNKS